MSWGIVAGAAVGLVGAGMSADASRRAGNTQAAAASQAAASQLQATRESNQLTADMYRQGALNYAPYTQSGQVALSALMGAMGLGSAQNAGLTGAGTGAGADRVVGAYVNALGQAVDVNGNPLVETSTGIGDTNYGATNEQLQQAAGRYANQLTDQFTGQDLYMDPSYQFRLTEGQRALRAQQAAGGNRWGGQAMKDITNYAQGAASQEYGNAYNRFMDQKNTLYNRLAAMAGTGQTAGQGLASLGSNAATTMGSNLMSGTAASNNYLTSGAAAQAAGQVGASNAIVGGLNNAMNTYYQQQYMDILKNRNGG